MLYIKQKSKILILILLTIALLPGVSGCTDQPTVINGFTMDSAYTLTIYANDTTAKNIGSEISNVAKQSELLLSAFDENSAIYKLNKNKKISLNDAKEIADIITLCSEISKLCDDRYSIVCGAVTRLWNIGNDTYIPTSEEAQNAAALCKYSFVLVDDDGIYILKDNVTLDLGSVGKGFACDKALSILENSDVSSAIVSFGGSILTYKTKNNQNWKVDIRSPFDNSAAGQLSIDGTAFISTSGGYERFFEKDGQTFHHIFDLKNGMPSNSDLASVTVISQNGVLSDALSTACFILGVQEAKKILDSFENTAAVFIKNDGSIYTYKSQNLFTANSGFEVKGEI